jgi:uncharacterized protein YceK
MSGCGTIIQITEEGLAPYGGTLLDVVGFAVGVRTFHPIALLALIDLPFSLTLDTILFIPSLLFGGDYLSLFG